jgi:very-short-patch-repair endonuclease
VPRQSGSAVYGGGAARSLRQGAAPGTLPAMEAHMRVCKSINLKSASASLKSASLKSASLKSASLKSASAELKSVARLELFARQHRSWLTESEALLWSALKARRLGVSFRRQAPVGGQFIADFCAPSIGLIVEVDGGVHERKRGADARRDRKLRRLGFRTVRVSAELVLADLNAAIALVRAGL